MSNSRSKPTLERRNGAKSKAVRIFCPPLDEQGGAEPPSIATPAQRAAGAARRAGEARPACGEADRTDVMRFIRMTAHGISTRHRTSNERPAGENLESRFWISRPVENT